MPQSPGAALPSNLILFPSTCQKAVELRCALSFSLQNDIQWFVSRGPLLPTMQVSSQTAHCTQWC